MPPNQIKGPNYEADGNLFMEYLFFKLTLSLREALNGTRLKKQRWGERSRESSGMLESRSSKVKCVLPAGLPGALSRRCGWWHQALTSAPNRGWKPTSAKPDRQGRLFTSQFIPDQCCLRGRLIQRGSLPGISHFLSLIWPGQRGSFALAKLF
jgi:hypothetical protein